MTDLPTSTPDSTTVFTATFRPHPKGFGFATVNDDSELPPRIFVPPQLARGLIADDVLTVTARADDKGFTATARTVVNRPRRMLSGVVARRAGRDVIIADPALSSSWVGLDAGVADQLAHAENRVVVVLLTDNRDELTARALVAGPYVDGSPQAVRARTVVSTFGRVTPSGYAGASDSDLANATLTHLKLTGLFASGKRGAADTLDRTGPVPGDVTSFTERRDEPCVTIDGEHSRDLDDAVFASWDGTADSDVHVAVHIVDAARAIGIGSAADRYARVAAATTYFTVGPNGPMIDPTLSEDALSLLANVDRYVLSVRFTVDRYGQITNQTIESAVICSRAKLSYGDLHLYLGGDTSGLTRHGATATETLAPVLDALIEAANRLGTNRDAHTSLSSLFTDITEEPAIVDGRLTVVAAETFPDANRIVERLMVAANETVAGWLTAHNVAALYRNHAGLDVTRAARVFAAFRQFGVDVSEPDDIHAAGQTLIAALISATEAATDDPTARDLLIQVLAQATARATYSPTPAAHVGLNAAQYTHFTSPLRRYADLVVHRQLRATLAGEPAPYSHDQLAELGVWLDARLGVTAQLASAERSALWDLLLARKVVPADTTATVTGVLPAGLRLRFASRGTTGFLPAKSLASDPLVTALTVDVNELATTDGRWQVGQTLAVAFDGLDPTGRANWRLTGASQPGSSGDQPAA